MGERPDPIRRTWIPKPGSKEKRPLGIPTVVDRVVQTATRMGIEPIFEQVFAPQSYGFRPGRSCKDALRRVDELLKSGHGHAVDIDIKGFFDAISHELLLKQVEKHIADGRVLNLLKGWFGYFKQVDTRDLKSMAGDMRARLRAIMRKRKRLQGRSRGRDHQRWPNQYVDQLGLFCLETAQVELTVSLRGAKC